MPSISSASQIRQRTSAVMEKIPKESFLQTSQNLIFCLINQIKHEYSIIPQHERIGKGIIYVCKYIAKEFVSFLVQNFDFNSERFLKLCRKLYDFKMKNNYISLKYLSLLILANYLLKYPHSLSQAINLIELAATDEEWSVRETAIYPIISCLKTKPDLIFPYLYQLTDRTDEKLRRLVSESLRPSGSIKWLKNPQKNDKILSILSRLKTDESIYVRKSVGNNLKDLSKYMPGKILDLMENWVKLANIQVKDDLASEKGLNKEEKKLIWTIKHAMRWIRKKNPEYHGRLEAILGKNYILYFDEKSNKFAKPR